MSAPGPLKTLLIASFSLFILSGNATAQCTLNPNSPSVTICQPLNGASVASPVRVVAGTTSSTPVTLVQIYVDGVKQSEVKSSTLDTSIPIAAGARRLTVQANNGTWFKSTINITVTSGGGGPSLAEIVTYKNGNSRQGVYVEPTFTPGNVNVNTFRKKGSWQLDGTMFAQPLFLPKVSITGKGTFDVIFAATEHDSLYALNANSPGSAPLWKRSFIDSTAGITTVPANSGGRTSLGSQVGITGTPVIDPASGTLYLVTMTEENGKIVHRLRAIDVRDGADKLGGSPIITATVKGTGDGHNANDEITFNSPTENQRPGLALVNGVVYVAFASFSDVEPYHGWIFAYDASTLDLISAHNVSSDTEGGGIWQAGSAPAADADGNIYVETGDGEFGSGDFGDSFLRLRIIDGSLQPMDWFTPYNQDCINRNDIDLGSSGPTLLPRNANGIEAIVGGSKEGRVYLINAENMGQFHAGSDSQIIQSIRLNPTACGTTGFSASSSRRMYGSPAYWNGNVYVASVFGPLIQYKYGTELTFFAQSTNSFRASGQSGRGPLPVVSTTGTGSGIVWLVDRQFDTGTSILRAYDASNVSKQLYNSSQNSTRDSMGSGTVFTVPVIVNGRVYVTASSRLVVYGLN